MIPRPAHIQGQFRQGIESLDFRGQEAVYGVANTGVFAHSVSCKIFARSLGSYIITIPINRTISPSLPLFCENATGGIADWRRFLTTPDGDTVARKEQRHGEHLADAHEALPRLHNARDDERERREYFVKAELPALRSSPSAYPPLIPQ